MKLIDTKLSPTVKLLPYQRGQNNVITYLLTWNHAAC